MSYNFIITLLFSFISILAYCSSHLESLLTNIIWPSSVHWALNDVHTITMYIFTTVKNMYRKFQAIALFLKLTAKIVIDEIL